MNAEPASIYYTYLDSPASPVGPLLLTSDGTALTGLYLDGHKHGPRVEAGWLRNDDAAPFARAKRQLDDYFAGTLRGGFDLPLAPAGTPFQERVWRELSHIPCGTTLTYGELARRIGAPGAARAVGLANGRNPVSIIVPCHRVVGANGRLIGYAGGLAHKQALLALEAKSAATTTER